jgi:hypothetical protein
VARHRVVGHAPGLRLHTPVQPREETTAIIGIDLKVRKPIVYGTHLFNCLLAKCEIGCWSGYKGRHCLICIGAMERRAALRAPE